MYIKQVKDVLTLYGGLIILKVIMETKYQNLINYIQEQISEGQLGPGEKVPSENQLSEQFHISRQTVRKAIGTLEEDGLVQRIRGSGTYVSFDRRKNLEQRNSTHIQAVTPRAAKAERRKERMWRNRSFHAGTSHHSR